MGDFSSLLDDLIPKRYIICFLDAVGRFRSQSYRYIAFFVSFGRLSSQSYIFVAFSRLFDITDRYTYILQIPIPIQ